MSGDSNGVGTAAGLHQALTGMSTLMRQAGSNYEQTEQANARAFAR